MLQLFETAKAGMAAAVRTLPLLLKYWSPDISSRGAECLVLVSLVSKSKISLSSGQPLLNIESTRIKNAPAISIKHWWWRWARRKQGTTVITKVSSKRRTLPTRDVEQQLWAQGYQAVAGVDESGTGALAGPVVAAAAILPPGSEVPLLRDSKQLSDKQRQAIYAQLTTHPDVSYAVAEVDAPTIDRFNAHQAALLAMRAAVEGLVHAGLPPDYLLIDGSTNQLTQMPGEWGHSLSLQDAQDLRDTPVQLIVRGDASVTCIAAASVLATVSRDKMMMKLAQQYPQYCFVTDKGYANRTHRAALKKFGPSPVHRRSYKPVKSVKGWPVRPQNPAPAGGQVVAATVAWWHNGAVGSLVVETVAWPHKKAGGKADGAQNAPRWGWKRSKQWLGWLLGSVASVGWLSSVHL